MLWGATAMPGQATADTVAAYGPLLRYMRDFGDDGGDPDALPELPPHGRGKWLAKPPGCLLHCGWKDDVEALGPWLDGLHEDIWLTWWHENHGDAGQSPALYRATATRMVEIIRAHPNGHHVVGNGPAVTRYWLVQKRGNPLDYWYAGATIYFVDVYADGPDDKAGYRPGAELIGEALAPIRAALPGVDIGLSEYGLRLIGDDTGPGRAAAMVEHASYLNAQPDVVGAAWWDIGGCRITGRPEEAVLRQILQEATPVTVAKPNLLTARRLLLDRLDTHPGSVVDDDLDPGEVGIVGDEDHRGGYHVGRDRLDPDEDYSVVESARDRRGLAAHPDWASAVDVGRFEVVTADGQVHNLRTFSRWLVEQCEAGAPDTADIREVIWSPDGERVLRWDRLRRRDSGDSSHRTHTHISEHRDADGSRMVALFQRYIDEVLEDGMTPEQARAAALGGVYDALRLAAAQADGDPATDPGPTGRQLAGFIRTVITNPIIAALGGVDEQVIAGLAPRFGEVLAAIAADPDTSIDLSPEQVEELAVLLAARLPAPPTAAEIADAVNDDHAARMTS